MKLYHTSNVEIRVPDTLSADVIIGPIANDTIFETFGIISSGYLTTEQAMKLSGKQNRTSTRIYLQRPCWRSPEKTEIITKLNHRYNDF